MKAIHLFNIKNIPVAFSPWYLLLMLILGSTADTAANGLIFVAVATFSILMHEFGHAAMAKKYSLNPSIVLHAWGGVTLHRPTLNNKHSAAITAAGPSSGLIIAAVVLAIKLGIDFSLGSDWLTIRPMLNALITYLLWVNIVWSLFNLLPIFPLDGGQLLSSGLRAKFNPLKAKKILHITSIVVAILLIIASLVFKFNSLFIAFFALMMIFANYEGLRSGSKKKASDNPDEQNAFDTFEKIAQQKAARGDWEELRDVGTLMTGFAVNEQQLRRAYEVTVIALTNLQDYQAAYKLIPSAEQSPAVVRAKERCMSQLNLKPEHE